MARANRYYLPGYVWHITHRCHKKEFLLKFDKDKKRWLYWLFEAKKRYGLNYTVRNKVVDHPKDWKFGGYNEIMNPTDRYTIINRKRLRRLLKISDKSQLQTEYDRYVDHELLNGYMRNDFKWSSAIAVGSEEFVTGIQEKLGLKADKRKVVSADEVWTLNEPGGSYS